MAYFEPKVGQYWYQHFYKITGYVWRVWLKNSETSDSKVKDFDNKLDAVAFVHKMNGWGQ